MATPSQIPEESPVPSSSSHRKPNILRLPVEIVKEIYTYLSNRDIKNVRLTCSFFSGTATLRLDRVFLSANPRNVEVFQAVANNEVYRARVTEIIWDDALLVDVREGPNLPDGVYDNDDYYNDDLYDELDEEPSPWPKWYRKPCKDNLDEMKSFKGADVERPDHVARAQQVAALLPMEEAWAHYQELLQQQRAVLGSRAHIRALEDAIGSFPALRRVTVTCAAHGRLFNPLYETPMIRAFPRGFNYPIPRGWPVTGLSQPDCPGWDDDDGGHWQGFRAVVRVLARNRDLGRVTEMRVDANWLETGLNSSLFEQSCDGLTDFQTVLARPNFKHLHLDLLVDPSAREADMYRRGLLKQALAGAAGGRGLEYLSFRTNTVDSDKWYVPLGTIFPESSLSRLCHFGLSRFFVKQDDLLAFLAALPPSVRTIELGLLGFMEGCGSHRTLLRQIRDTLGWKDRDPRPKLSIVMEGHWQVPGRLIWIEAEVDAFLYHGAGNPFGEGPEAAWENQARPGVGVVKDAFEPEHERPHAERWTLAELGYLKKGRGGLPPRQRPGA
ncbi:hypothetical protein SLS62_010497 [Diatrype stigma]|uniref:F-box domain-containing protein n=1 Tax=Diatrype stigma TaxID=117547 RepID=A0AAN9YGB2_9PEZI